MSILEIQNLSVQFNTYEGIVYAVDDLSLSIDKGKTLCVVGESGCGKSVTARSIMRLLPIPPAKITSGQIKLDSKNLLALPDKEMRGVRGNDIAMIFQDPMTSLNPVFTCGYQIQESIRIHQKMAKKDALKKAQSLLTQVGIPDAKKCLNEYPHQISGVMRQLFMFARAIT
jgi:peptide/nickel transport system ATP-binding protein